MTIGVSSDHRGYKLKEKLMKYLTSRGFVVVDYGTNSQESVDYPDYAFILCDAINNRDVDMGLAVCGSGIGISIACNKVKGIRCAKADSIRDAKKARLDNDANCLALSGRMHAFKAKDIVDTFFTTDFSKEERHIRRIDKIKEYEKEHMKTVKSKKVMEDER